MCGIVAYVGKKQAYPILITGLQRLAYRGYDSAGIALTNGHLNIYKRKGKVQDLVNYTEQIKPEGTVGIGHTRWATHGEPNDINAHPHKSMNGKLAIVHNGIIENYASLKAELVKRGHEFESQTDTEILIHLIEEVQKNEKVPLEEAVRLALHSVVGAYAIVVISEDEPGKLVAARKSSPLVIGLGTDEYLIASDATPIVEHTKNVIYLNDEEIAVIDLENGLNIKSIDNDHISPYIQELEMKLEKIEKGGYDHFMLKEIHEQSNTLIECLRGRLSIEKGILMGGFRDVEDRFIHAKRIIMIACGTSWHAALVGEYLFEDLARIPVEVEYASEFRYRNPVIYEDDIVIALSQSGETADTLAAIRLAKQKGATVFGICNVVGSSIARESHAGAYTHAGPEIGVASTKAFTTQLGVLTMMALKLAVSRNIMSNEEYRTIATELDNMPNLIAQTIKSESKIKFIADEFKDVQNFLYLGRGYNFPIALEGALKLKEISYIHAEGYPAAEMKHGPIALIDEQMPVVVMATNESAYEKIISNIQEVKARKGRIIAITTFADETIRDIADYVIQIPETLEPLTPILSVIPLQLLAYHIAVNRECDVDQPRNLAKSVTVE